MGSEQVEYKGTRVTELRVQGFNRTSFALCTYCSCTIGLHLCVVGSGNIQTSLLSSHPTGVDIIPNK